jgi:Fe-S cluster biogenesis protein NfuA/nitrite reductase/ring-hydroxylating ferredoxin subunit
MATAPTSVEGSIERVQELTEHLDSIADPGIRAITDELTAAIVQMYGVGIERMLRILEQTPGAEPAREAFAADELISSLLLIHDLHPVPVDVRAARALDRVRPYMESHGGNVEFLGIEDGVAKLRLQGSCKSCSASSATLELAVRQALEELCPDLEGMDVEGVPGPEVPGFPGVALPMAADSSLGGGSAWFDAGGLDDLPPEGLAGATVAGAALVVANVEGTLLAYRDECASCGAGFDGAELRGATLVCPGCANAFVLTAAGRGVSDPALQLEPVPLLRRGETVQVALSVGKPSETFS